MYIDGTEGKCHSSMQLRNSSVNGTLQTVAPAQPGLTVDLFSRRTIGLFADEELMWPDPSHGSAVHPLVSVLRANQ